MTAEDNGFAPSEPGEQPSEQHLLRRTRQRAADFFSQDGLREGQADPFEGAAMAPTGGEATFPAADDFSDPPLFSDAPAAEAARAYAEGVELRSPFDMLTPVELPYQDGFPWSEGDALADFAEGAEFAASERLAVESAPVASFPDGAGDQAVGYETAGYETAGYEGTGYETAGYEAAAPEAAGYQAAGYQGENPAGYTAFGEADTAQLEPYAPQPPADGVEGGDPYSPGQWQGEGVVEQATETDPAATKPRSGRNLPLATAVGLVLLAAAVGAAVLHPLAFAGLLYLFAVGAVIEWKRALERHGRRIPMVPLIAATLGLGVATYYGKAEGLVVALLVGCAGVVAWRIGDERIENTLADSLAGVLTLLWIPFLASFLFLLELADDGWERVVIVVLAVVGNDTGALIAGMLFGRHKLLPRVSPAKTWEGAIGGVVLGTLAASVAAFFFFDGKWYIGVATGIACTIAAVFGDLAESALKRDIQVKDMSTVLPGHGGILDRIDSLLFAAPVGYVVFAIFLGTRGGGGL